RHGHGRCAPGRPAHPAARADRPRDRAVNLPANWPIVTLALGLALVLSYLFAEFVSRLAQSVLHAIIEDRHVQKQFVDRPRRVVKLLVFMVAVSTLLPPSLKLAGYRIDFGGSPEALFRWFLDAGLRIV